MKIFKYVLSPNSPQLVELPEGAQVLTAQSQRDDVCLWALVDPEKPTQKRYFEVFATGEDVSNYSGIKRRYIGTVQLNHGSFIFHVFERLQ